MRICPIIHSDESKGVMFYLKKAVLNPSAKIEISEARFLELKKSRELLSSILLLEEQWDAVLQNFIELEQNMLKEAVKSMVVTKDSYDDFQDIRLGFARTLSNLLSSCRSYLHHTPQHLEKILGRASLSEFKNITHEAYDAYFGYRFMEALRNHSQHHGMPIDGASFGMRWIESDDEREEGLRHHVTTSINLQKLRENKKFKRSVLSEISDERKKVNLAPLVREHIEALGGIHEKVRGLVRDKFENAKLNITTAIEEYENVNDGNSLGLAAFNTDEKGEVLEIVHVLKEVVSRVERLSIRNGSTRNFSKRFVTNELEKLLTGSS